MGSDCISSRSLLIFFTKKYVQAIFHIQKCGSCVFSQVFSRKKKYEGGLWWTFVLPPQPIRFNYCLNPPPIKSNFKSILSPTYLISFLEDPLLKKLNRFFVYKTQQPTRSHLNEWYPQKCIFEKDNHLQNYIFTKYKHPLDWKTTNSHQPHKIIVLCLQRPPYIFYLEQPSLSTRIHVSSGCSLNETRSCMLNLIMSYKSHPKTS